MPRRRAPKRLDPAKLAPVLHELMPVGGGELPSEVLGFHDAAGHCRRITATYPSGWKVEVRLNRELEVTSTQATLRLVSRKASRA